VYFYGPDGRNQGSARESGRTTYFYGADGGAKGQASTAGERRRQEPWRGE
jgi:hypothetical protein